MRKKRKTERIFHDRAERRREMEKREKKCFPFALDNAILFFALQTKLTNDEQSEIMFIAASFVSGKLIPRFINSFEIHDRCIIYHRSCIYNEYFILLISFHLFICFISYFLFLTYIIRLIKLILVIR